MDNILVNQEDNYDFCRWNNMSFNWFNYGY